MNKTTPHPVCTKLRQLRKAAGLTLKDMEDHGVSAVLMGSYERGDRTPPLPKLDALLGRFGYKIVAVPVEDDAIRAPGDMVAELRAIAAQLEHMNAGGKIGLAEVQEMYPRKA